jgi:transporter family protein
MLMIYFFAFIIAFIWGLSPVLVKYLIKNNNIPTYIIILIQSIIYAIASILYIIIYKIDYIYNDINIHKKHIPLLALISLLSVYIANVLYIYIISKGISINIISIIISLYPIITFIFAYFILNETITINTLMGFLLIIMGLIIIFR